MEFSLDRFYRVNRKAIIWIVLFGLIYLLRDFFTLIFLTFIISFFAFPASKYLQNRLRLNQSLTVILVYLAIVVGYIALYVMVLPNVVLQASKIRNNLPDIQATLNDLRVEYTEKYPNIAWLFNQEESSMLKRGEITDWPQLYHVLLSETNPPGPRIQELLPKDLLMTVRRRANRLSGSPGTSPSTNAPAASGSATNAASAGSGISSLSSNGDTGLQDRILGSLNTNIINNPNFYLPEAFPDLLPATNETSGIRDLLHKREREGLTEGEVQKLNRLLLEDSFGFIQRQGYLTEQRIEQWIDTSRRKLQEYMPKFGLAMLQFFGTSLLAILFSFMIVFDYARVSREVQGLANSKLRDFFVEAGQPVVKFAISVGEGFRAIATIALITTIMVVMALIILGISSVAFLAVIAFLTSLIPVVGIFFEAVPVALVALNEHGAERAFWALVALAIIHVIIGYVITPIIFGRQFKINLVAVLFILFVGNQIAGVWGMLLGVPIANYLLREVLGVPMLDEHKSAPAEEKVAGAPTPQDSGST